MPAIGPYQFTTLRGRLLTSTAGIVTTAASIKLGPRQASPQTLIAHEHQASFVAAWRRAYQYRWAVGALARVVDDTGITADYCLINDVRTTVRVDESGAILESQWLIIPPIGYGDYGGALNTTALDTGGAPLLTAPTTPVPASTTIRVLIPGLAITFDTATGDLQIPLFSSQVRDVVHAAKAIGVDAAATEPAPAGGSLRCDVALADDAAAFRMQTMCRLLVGSAVTFDLGGVSIPGAVIKDAQITWCPAPGLAAGKTVLLTVLWGVELQSTDGDDDTARTSGGSCVEVQCAAAWGTWQTVAGARCDEGEEGLYPAIGSLTWSLDLGATVVNRRQRVIEPVSYRGLWCRAQLKTNAKGEPDPLGRSRVDLWFGKVMATSISGGSATAGATLIASCAGVLAAWEQIYLTRWYEVGQAGLLADPGELLAFNGAPGGDASAITTETVGGQSGLVVHDRQNTAATRRWTALQALTMLLAALRDEHPGHPSIILSGQTSALGYTVDFASLDGRPLSQQVAAIIDPRRGAVWRIEPNGNGWKLRISSSVGADTTIPGMPPIPANDRQRPVDLTATDVLTYRLGEDATPQVDRILETGARPWCCLTLGIDTNPALPSDQFALERAWTQVDADTRATLDTNAREVGRAALVYRKYRLMATWRGGGRYNATRNDVLRMAREIDATGAETGTFLANGNKPDARNLRFTRELPIWQGRDWATVAYGEQPPDPSAQLEGPIVVGVKANAAGYENLSARWQVQVCDDEPAVILGRTAADGDEIAAYLAAGNKILVTLGVLGPLPWRVSWRRAPSARPCDLERVLMRHHPDVGYRILIDGTVLGVATATTLLQSSSADTKTGATGTTSEWALDNATGTAGSSRLDPQLQLARTWSEFPDISLTYARRGLVDTATATGPGAWITTATVPLDASRSYVAPINALITGRRWRVAGLALETTYSASRLPLAMADPIYGRAVAPPPVAVLANGGHQ